MLARKMIAGMVTVCLLASTSLGVRSNEILLKSRRFSPAKGISAGAKARIGAIGKRAHVLIQLERIPTVKERKELEAKGIKLLSYVPNKAWFASIAADKAGEIAGLSEIRAISEILAEDKISPHIRAEGVNEYSTNEKGEAKLVVVFFGDVSLDEGSEVISSCGGTVEGKAGIINALVVSLSEDLIDEVASDDRVQWIDQHYEPEICNDGSRAAIGVDTVQASPYDLNGIDVVIGEWDGGCVSDDHNDLKKLDPDPNQSRVTEANCSGNYPYHATHVAGTMIGNGYMSHRTGEGAGCTEVNDVNGLQAIDSNLTGCFVLVSDINAAGVDFEPIGEAEDEFTGEFYGQGFKIMNLDINKPGEGYVGLFGATKGATIKNVVLEDVNVIGRRYVGALVGYAQASTVEGCSASGSVTGSASGSGVNKWIGGLIGWLTTESDASGISDVNLCSSSCDVLGTGSEVGGLIGCVDGVGTANITNCHAVGSIKRESSTDYVGGLIGKLAPGGSIGADVKNCYADADIDVNGGGAWWGGFAGWCSSKGYIEQCCAIGDINNASSYGCEVGGFVGRSYGEIRESYAWGSVSVTDGSEYIGGFGGCNRGDIKECYSVGNVTGGDWCGAIGGFCGEHGCSTCQSAVISDCFAWGTINVGDDCEYLGGFVGYNYYASIVRCYSIGDVNEGSNPEEIGGFCGDNDGDTSYCHWNRQTCSESECGCGGVGVSDHTTAEMKQASTFTNWDFDDVWYIFAGETYPFLRASAWGIWPVEAPIPMPAASEPNLWAGMAPEANVISYLWWDSVSDMNSDYNDAITNYEVDISQNSWGIKTGSSGCGIMGDYVSECEALDKIVTGSVGDKRISIIWAGGNERSENRCGGDGYTYGTIIPYGTAKNVITVGAVNSDGNEADSNFPFETDFSSWGPTDDGRIKPDVVAPGCQEVAVGRDNGIVSTIPGNTYTTRCGTSMAAPAVSGSVALMVQYWRQDPNADPNILPSTIKAILIQTAKDLGNAGPDYSYGYGLIDVNEAIKLIEVDDANNDVILEDTIVDVNDVDYFGVNVPGGLNELRITLAWDDHPGTLNSSKALINDLDLIVKDPCENRYYPWVLDPNDPCAAAEANRPDSLNNVEQVDVNEPESGWWMIEVAGGDNFPNAPQKYSLVSNVGMLSPTIITDVNGLQAMENGLGKYYQLGNDINASATSGWDSGAGFDPVGSQAALFTGIFDGQGHTITGLYIDRPSEGHTGLFGLTMYALIKDVNVADANVTGLGGTGILVGSGRHSKVYRCCSSGTLRGTASDQGPIGGLMGSSLWANTVVSRCHSSADVTAIGDYYTTNRSGGLVGLNNKGSIIIDCYATGDVSGKAKIGGLVGDNTWGSYGGYIKRCYSTGQVTCPGFGGGGLVGFNYQGGVTYDSYWDVNTSGWETSYGGTGKTTTEMMDVDTFEDWDFVNVWDINDGNSYPYLRE